MGLGRIGQKAIKLFAPESSDVRVTDSRVIRGRTRVAK